MERSNAFSARLALGFAIVSALAMALGLMGAAAGLLPPIQAFLLFAYVGLGLALAALVTGLIALWRTRPTRGVGGRGRAWLAILLGAGAMAAILGPALGARQLPVINDISTDLDDPPRFVATARDPGLAGRDLAYPGPAFAAQQRAGYPDLEPIRVALPPAEALARSERAARDLGWNVVATDPAAGTLEAQAISRLFRFVDDVVVRVRPVPDGSGSIVDVRSKSREGRGDLGANAARIRRFRDALANQS
jgi:uncharacterized protein (DUF1499 family)